MDQKWNQMLLILLFCQKFISADKVIVKDGADASVLCDPKEKNTIFWFRVLDGSNMEFIASFSSTGMKKSVIEGFDTKYKMANEKTLVIKSFSNKDDSGMYGCAALYKGNELKFGPITRVGEAKTEPVTIPAVLTTTQTKPTTKPCKCTEKKPGLSMFCNPIILGSLAGGCGLLLLLLIIITLYCNKMRTRRCPHHYKRKPRMDGLEKQMMTNRHV
uniref:CD8 antigen, alpha polypeptide n=2 Tax=Iconisemion striatum TaxID=60296 RepID=A0A1A7XBL6_9TELE